MFHPGELTATEAQRLNEIEAMLRRLDYGNIRAAPPLDLRDDPTGVSFFLDIDSFNALNNTSTTVNWFHDVLNYFYDQINYDSNTITFRNNRSTFIAEQWNIDSLTINNAKGNFGGLTIGAFLEICGYQFWCCEDVSSIPSEWTPIPGATVYPYTGGDTILNGIVPVGIYSVPQLSLPAAVSSDTTLMTVFPGVTSGGNLVVQAWGHCTTTPSPTLMDSQSNSYTQDVLISDSISGLYAGLWHSSGSSTTAAAVTFNSGVGPGKIVMQAAEVSNLTIPPGPSAFAQSAMGNSSLPSVGSVSLGSGFFLPMVMASADPSNPATIATPSGLANFFQELDGQNFTTGSADYTVPVPGSSSFTPTYTTDQSARWVAATAGYPLKAGPQLLTIANVGSGKITIKNNNASSGKPIFLPRGYKDPVASTWQVDLYPQDVIVLWYDACGIGTGADGWYVLACTVSEFGASINNGSLVFEPHLNLVAGTGITLTQSDDTANLRSSVSISASGGGSSSIAGAANEQTSPGYTLTNTMASTGLTLALPGAGNYFIFATVSGNVTGPPTGDIVNFNIKLTTANAFVWSTDPVGYTAQTTPMFPIEWTTTANIVLNVTSADTMTLYAKSTQNVGQIYGGTAEPPTVIGYMKIG